MYRVNPFTYVVDGFLGTSLANASVTCAANEVLSFSSPGSISCGEYLAEYTDCVGGYVINPDASQCEHCPMVSTNAFLNSLAIDFDNRWRSFGILWVFNIGAVVFIYWLARVPEGKNDKRAE